MAMAYSAMAIGGESGAYGGVAKTRLARPLAAKSKQAKAAILAHGHRGWRGGWLRRNGVGESGAAAGGWQPWRR